MLQFLEKLRRWWIYTRKISRLEVTKRMLKFYNKDIDITIGVLMEQDKRQTAERDALLQPAAEETPEQSKERTRKRKALDKQLYANVEQSQNLMEAKKRNELGTKENPGIQTLGIEIDELYQRRRDLWRI